MKFDINKTISLTKGGLASPRETWQTYLGENPGWQQTAMVLTAPLIILNVLLTTLFSRLTGGMAPYGMHGGFFSNLVWGLISAVIFFFLAVLLFNLLADVFKGKSNFSRAFAALSLAAIPSWIAGIVAALLPGFLGTLIALAGGITALVFLYRILPLALEIPDSKRVVHFIASLVSLVIAAMIIGMLFGALGMPSGSTARFDMPGTYGEKTGNGNPSFIDNLERQAELITAAEGDRYEPPEDGKLSKSQVKQFAKVMQKTRAAQTDFANRAEQIGNQLKAREERGESPSLADMGAVFAGLGGAVNAANVEMEIVKTGGGNWAEHKWVKNQLRVAKLQQGDGPDEVEHNYKLYQKYREQIEGQ